ncbi:MFS drug efflux transporter [Halenospora varia]|nr:MFS drug efflux transporter [Halenospora varia]
MILQIFATCVVSTVAALTQLMKMTLDKSNNIQDVSACTSQTAVSCIDPEKQIPQPGSGVEPPPRDINGFKWVLVITAILSSIFLYALDATVVADIQPVIVKEFNSLENLTWLGVGFLLGATATNLLWGKIYGQFNAKWTYIFCVAFFEVGSAICGAAPNMTVEIIGRVICGVSGSGLYVGVMTLIATTTSLPERPMYIGLTGLTWGLGIVLGPVIGGAFSDSSAGWRWAFYINLCIGAVCAPVYLFLLPNRDPRPGVKFLERGKEMDYLGCVLVVGAFVSGVMAINWGGLTYAWGSGRIIGLFVTSGVLFIVLGLQQVYLVGTTVERRLIPVEFFGSRTVLILFATTAASGAAAFVPIYMIPIFFQFTRGDGALDAGVRLLPFIALLVFSIFGNGALMAKFGYYMPWYTVGGLLAVIGGACMYTVDQSTSVANIYGFSIILGFGIGLWTQASFSVAQAVVSPHLIPSAVGFITCAQFLGITLSLAIANSLFLNESQISISAILPGIPLSEIRAAMEGTSSLLDRLGMEVREMVIRAIVEAIGRTFILVIVAGALVVVLSLGMKREKVFISAGIATA